MVQEVANFWEVDVIMTICCNAEQSMINKFPDYIPLEDGSIEEMFCALETAHKNGEGTIAMKVLGSGCPPLTNHYRLAIRTIAKLDFVDARVV